MKDAIRKALRIFCYLSILFTVLWFPYMFYDDYIFIEKYGLSLEGIGIWLLWYFAYFIAFSLYYWLISTVLILIYYKLVKRKT